GRSVEEDFVRGNPAAEALARRGGEGFAGPDQPRVGLAGDSLVPFAVLEVAEFGQPLVEAASWTEEAAQQIAGRRVSGCEQLVNKRRFRQPEELVEVELPAQQEEGPLQHRGGR